MSNDTPSPSELQRRLLFALLRPVARVCQRFQIPLDEVEQLCRLAYYEALRRDGELTQTDVARIFGKSRRTVVTVEQQFRTDFLAPAEAAELDRRFEELLATGPHPVRVLAEQLGLPEAEAARRATALVAAGRAVFDETTTPGGYRLADRLQSLVRPALVARLDGLTHQLEVISAAVGRRFFGEADDDAPSVARTLSFVGRREDVTEMATALVHYLRLAAVDVEEKALATADYERFGVTVALAPMTDSED